MGLDFSIELKIKNKDFIKEIEMAYWRKCYSIRDNIINFCINSGFLIKADEDFSYECKIDILLSLINYIREEYKNSESELFCNSIWGESDCKEMTYNQIIRLENFNTILYSIIHDINPELYIINAQWCK